MCFWGLEEAFDREPRKVLEWTMRKKGKPKVLVRSEMSLYEGVKTRVRVNYELSEEYEVKVEMHQEYVPPPFLFALVMILSPNLPEGALSELLHADDLVLMSETIEGLWVKFLKGKEAFESKGLKVNHGKKHKVMVVVVVASTPSRA